ncbi:MAG TPA: hypothetical protein VLL08_20380 [Kineosporiaceae bacterium]|nr:hypothetical protein [Kineosporiaceae bacterium]
MQGPAVATARQEQARRHLTCPDLHVGSRDAVVAVERSVVLVEMPLA